MSLTAEQIKLLNTLTPGMAKIRLGDLLASVPMGSSPISSDELAAFRALGTTTGDLLLPPVRRVTLTGAMSTTAVLSATATSTVYKARIAWNNNGANAAAKLNIFVNAANDVHGLVASQSAKRRDYQLTMGDSVILVSPTPITRVHFSSDVSISNNTHQLHVAFGG
jgi:hypothetical protein